MIKQHSNTIASKIIFNDYSKEELLDFYDNDKIGIPILFEDDLKFIYKLTQDGQCGFPASGSFNINCNYNTSEGNKLSFRYSKESFFYVTKNQSHPKGKTYSINVNPDILEGKSKKTFLDELNKSKKNWLTASRLNLSPEVYFYGYIKIRLDSQTYGLHPVIISKAYDMDLSTYYLRGPGKQNMSKQQLQDNDESIASQLIYLLQELHTKMGLICYDIKPANAVIDIDSNEVRLIDWDADWCKEYTFLNVQSSDRQDKNSGIISHILMANHFFRMGRNIFCNYFQNNLHNIYGRNVIFEHYEALEELFCRSLLGKEDTMSIYQFMSNHYFRLGIDDCNTLFETLVRNSKKINNESPETTEKIGATDLRQLSKVGKKQKGGTLDDCINTDDPISMNKINSENVVKIKTKEPTKENNQIYNCYNKDEFKKFIQHKIALNVDINNIKDPLTNIPLGKNFIKINYPEIDINDVDDYIDIIDSMLTEINSEEEYDVASNMIDDLSQYLLEISPHIPDNLVFGFSNRISDMIEDINSPNKQNLLYEVLNNFNTDNNDRMDGGRKKQKNKRTKKQNRKKSRKTKNRRNKKTKMIRKSKHRK
jgi:hypothetical protein